MNKSAQNGMPLSAFLNMYQPTDSDSSDVYITAGLDDPESQIDRVRRDVAIAQYGDLPVTAVIPRSATKKDYHLIYVCPDYKPRLTKDLLVSHNRRLAFGPVWRTGDEAYIVGKHGTSLLCRITSLSDINGEQTATVTLPRGEIQTVPVPCLFETYSDTREAVQHEEDCEEHPEQLHTYKIRAVRCFTATVRAHNLKEALSIDPGQHPPEMGSNVLQEFLPVGGFKVLHVGLDTDYFQEGE